MASKAVGLLTFNFGANLDGFDRAMKKSQKKLKKFGNNVKKIGSSLTTNLTLPIAALGVVSVKSFDQQAKAEMKLLTALKGREDIQNRLIEQAKELQKTTLFGDEATIESQALLASLGLTEEQILMLMPQIQNMATALGMDLTAATSLVSKSVSTSTDALARYFDTGLKGVTGQQERAIVLTGALTEKFDGQSEAAAKVGSGPLIQMKNQLGDLTEQLGKRLMPYIIQFVGWMTKMMDKFDSLSSSQKDNIVKWGLILAAIGPVLLIVGKAILAYGQLKIAVIAVNTFMMANPWALAAAAIAVVVAGVYKLVKAFNYQIDVQKELNDLNQDAQKSIADDLVNIDLLTGAIESETTSLEDKKKALNDLKSIYPGYYDEIDEATFSSDMLKQSTDKLKESLINVAKVTAYKDKLTEIQRQIIDLEEKGNVSTEVNVGTQVALGNLAPLVKIFDLATGTVTEFKQNVQENIDTKEISELTKLTDELTTKIAELNKTTSDIAPVSKVTHTTTNKKVETQTSSVTSTSPDFEIDLKELEKNHKLALNQLKETQLTERKSDDDYNKILESEELKHLNNMRDLFNKYGNDVVDLDGKIIDHLIANQEKLDEDPFANYRNSLGKLGEKIAEFTGTELKDLENGLAGMVNKLGDNLAQGAESFEEFGKTTLGVLREVIGGLISTGVSLAVTAALETVMKTGQFWMIPVVAGAAAGLAKTAFNSLIPQFAEGGLVTGPTLGLIGEGAGTNAGNPEVVAPLDKLRSMIGGGNQNIVVEGRLAGNDIFLSNARTKFNRNRTV